MQGASGQPGRGPGATGRRTRRTGRRPGRRRTARLEDPERLPSSCELTIQIQRSTHPSRTHPPTLAVGHRRQAGPRPRPAHSAAPSGGRRTSDRHTAAPRARPRGPCARAAQARRGGRRPRTRPPPRAPPPAADPATRRPRRPIRPDPGPDRATRPPRVRAGRPGLQHLHPRRQVAEGVPHGHVERRGGGPGRDAGVGGQDLGQHAGHVTHEPLSDPGTRPRSHRSSGRPFQGRAGWSRCRGARCRRMASSNPQRRPPCGLRRSKASSNAPSPGRERRASIGRAGGPSFSGRRRRPARSRPACSDIRASSFPNVGGAADLEGQPVGPDRGAAPSATTPSRNPRYRSMIEGQRK